MDFLEVPEGRHMKITFIFEIICRPSGT